MSVTASQTIEGASPIGKSPLGDGHRSGGDPVAGSRESAGEHRIFRKNNRYLEPEKCHGESGKTTVEHIGVIVSHNSLAVDLVKAAVVLE